MSTPTSLWTDPFFAEEDEKERSASDHTARMLRGVSVAVTMSKDYEDTQGKRLLWTLLMSLLTPESHFRQRAQLLGFASTRVSIVSCGSGVALYTVCKSEWQVVLNLVVPCTEVETDSLVREASATLRRAYANYGLLCTPLHSQLPACRVPSPHPRRLITSGKAAKEAVLLPSDGTKARGVECQGVRVQACARVVTDRREVVSHKPLLLASPDTDPEGTTYWHRFPCGTVALLTSNPPLPFSQPIDLPPPLPNGSRIEGTGCVSDFMNALAPQHPDEVLGAVRADWIPIPMRCFVSLIGRSRFGITDDLVRAVGSVPLLESHQCESRCVPDMHAMATLFQVARECGPDMVLTAVATQLVSFVDQRGWMHWLTHSKFVYSLLDRSTPETVQRACSTYPALRLAMALLLDRVARRHDEGGGSGWTQVDVGKARVLSQDGVPPILADPPLECQGEEDPIESVRRRFAKLGEAANARADALALEEGGGGEGGGGGGGSKKERRGKQSGRRRGKGLSRGEGGTLSFTSSSSPLFSSAPLPTHHALVRRIAAETGLCCELIGSGVFMDTGDVDVVVTVDAPHDDLAAAYEDVASATGWTPRYHLVTGERVAVLTGTFEGVAVDVQVRRSGPPRCEAERATERAVLLARELERSADAACRSHVAMLHSLTDRARLKGHRLCLLPGVAVTCMGVAVARRGAEEGGCFGSLLARLRTRLAREAPRFDIDDLTEEEASPNHMARCTDPILVLTEQVSLATRLTAGTSRHVLDAVAHASLRFPSSPTRQEWDAWREAHMVIAARARAVEGEASTTLTLHSALVKLDGHPLVDAVHASEETDDGSTVVTLRVTLRSDASERYSFREGDELVPRQGRGVVDVVRGLRRWPLATTRRVGVGEREARWDRRREEGMGRKGSVLRLDDERVVPNAPSLTVDVLQCLDARHWVFVE